MTAENLILLILSHGEGRVSGKTLLQKRAYFVSEILGFNLGFKPHFYGPYSDEVEGALGQCKALGFVQENSQGFGIVNNGFEVRRYDYSLTEDGRKVVEFLNKYRPEECDQVRRCLDTLAKAGEFSDYVSLSVAAKTFIILKEKRIPMQTEEIRKTAESLNWDISPTAIEKGIEFLQNSNLVSVS